MTKIKRLTRGLKLLIDHIYTPLLAVADLLSKDGVKASNLDQGLGTFRLNFTFPLMHEHTRVVQADSESVMTAAFMLPPPQDQFSLSSDQIDNYILHEVSVSHDTRSEPARLAGVQDNIAVPFPQPLEEGDVIQGEGTAYTVRLSSKEVDKSKFESFSNILFEIKIPEVGLVGKHLRANPIVQSDIGINFHHDRTYLLEIVPDKIGQALFSPSISLKFARPLQARDTGLLVQNMVNYLGAIDYVIETPTKPSAGAIITADQPDGVNTGMGLIDRLIGNKLKGGYPRDIKQVYGQNLQEDAGYEVIAVPMFAGWSVRSDSFVGGAGAFVSYVSEQKPQDMPWSSAGPNNFHTMDRAIIPLQYPMTIQHVVIAANYARDIAGDLAVGSVRPVEPTFINEVGVGLLRGIRADAFNAQQVAHASWTPTTIGNFLIDRGDYKHSLASGISDGYSWDMLSCPLVGAGGTGYVAQGQPVFAGRGISPETSANRTVIAGAPPVTNGAEQVLDIRWKIESSVDPALWATHGSIVGHPGHWIYIICKKHLI
jgi:hypothetical protein